MTVRMAVEAEPGADLQGGNLRKNLKVLGAGVAAATALTLMSAPAAHAATKTLHAGESVRIRATASTSSAALGLVPKGAAAAVYFKDGAYVRYFGGAHNACGTRGNVKYNQWYKITYKGITGYVASACMW
uniref:SH3 domain-containing protein n=1 Tax=Streptomyces sp. 14R-10 TaxID=1442159 RepID=UPI001E60C3B9|nr:SH3 domain-containing protein [Streptomyces sp. 14R-10]